MSMSVAQRQKESRQVRRGAWRRPGSVRVHDVTGVLGLSAAEQRTYGEKGRDRRGGSRGESFLQAKPPSTFTVGLGESLEAAWRGTAAVRLKL